MSSRKKKPCWSCKKEIFLKDARQTRTRYPGGVVEYLCVECKLKLDRELVDHTRARLGMPPLDGS